MTTKFLNPDAISDNQGLFEADRDKLHHQIFDMHFNEIRGKEDFKATVVSSGPDGDMEQIRTQFHGTYIDTRLRPIGTLHDHFVPNQCSPGLSFQQAKRFEQLLPKACAITPMGEDDRPARFGDVVVLKCFGAGPNNDKFRQPRYAYPNKYNNWNYACTSGVGPLTSFGIAKRFEGAPLDWFVPLSSYVPSTTETELGPCVKQDNIRHIESAMDRFGITNSYTRIAILSVIKKESQLCPKNEKMKYSAGRLAEVWSRFSSTGKTVEKGEGKKYANALAHEYAGDDRKLANLVYAGKYGNRKGTEDGWNYRGRGFNQITFRGTYKKYAKIIGVDILNNPDLLNDPANAALAAVAFIQNRFKSMPTNKKGPNPNFTSQSEANLWTARANAGWGKGMGSSAVKRAIRLTNESAKYFVVSSTGKISLR
jgi:predicted chitinase